MNKRYFAKLSNQELSYLCLSYYKQQGYSVEIIINERKRYLLLSKNNKLVFINLLLNYPSLLTTPEVIQELNQLRDLGEVYNCFNYRIISPYGFQKKAYKLEECNLILSDWKYLNTLNETSEVYDLFPHNDLAYRKIKEGFKYSNKVAVVKPTGTGKSVLISALINDYNNKNVLVLTPSNFIIDQIKKHISWQDSYHFMTYAKTMNLKQREVKTIQPDLIVLDEFHRCGADHWGKGVNAILETYPNAKVLGTTATPVRQLDDARNMADEMFEGNVVVNMTLNTAIHQKILPTPKYISALYTLDEEANKLIGSIKNSQHEDKQGFIDKIIQAKLDWEQAQGITQIFKKHIDSKTKKIIVFTKNIEHLEAMQENVKSWFKNAGFKDINTYLVYSTKNDNKEEFKRFENANSNSLHLLFAVDMLNEGIHVKGVDGVILLRSTESDNIYYQQIGRSLTVDFNKQPLILDLVNNFNNIKIRDFVSDYNSNTLQFLKDGIKNYKFSFSIQDETKDITELFQSFSNTIESWNIFIEKLTAFQKEFGHCNVPNSYEDKWLLTKVSSERTNYKNGTLHEDRIQQLENMGFVWNTSNDNWNKFIKKLTAFKNEFGHCNVPIKYSDKWLGKRVSYTRERFFDKKLKSEKVKQLEKLGFKWELQKDDSEKAWDIFIEKLTAFQNEFGHCNVPSSYSDKWLAIKLKNVRIQYRDNVLDKGRIQQLENMEFVWNTSNDSWNKFIKKLTAFKNEFGHCNVPNSYEDKFIIGKISQNRVYYKKGKLSKERIQQLEEIGFKWEPKKSENNKLWNIFIEKLTAFQKEFGHCNVPLRYEDSSLGNKVGKCRAYYKKGKLSKERIQQLEELGFKWELK